MVDQYYVLFGKWSLLWGSKYLSKHRWAEKGVDVILMNVWTLTIVLTRNVLCYLRIKKEKTKQNNWQKGKQHFKKMLKEILSNGLMTGPSGEDRREGSPEQGTGFMCFMSWSIWKEPGKGNLLIGLLKGPPIKTFRTDAPLVTLF